MIIEKIREQLMPAVRIQIRPADVPVRFGVMVNACSTAVVYLHELIGTSENSIGPQASNDRLSASLQAGLDGLKQYVRELEDIRNSGLDGVASGLEKRMTLLAVTLREVSFVNAVTVQTETKFQDDFKRAFGDVFDRFRLNLNEENYIGLLRRLSGSFVQAAEEIIRIKKFAPAGAVLFRRIVKWLMGFFQDDDRFKRLLDIATVLTLPNPDELRSVYGKQCKNPNRVSLSGQELQMIVKQRTDWASHDLSFLMDL
jgi:hypothetical protein